MILSTPTTDNYDDRKCKKMLYTLAYKLKEMTRYQKIGFINVLY